MKRAALLLCVGVLAIAQNPGADISAYYRLTGAKPDLVKYPNSGGYPYRWIHIAPPLSVDSTNPDQPVLKVAQDVFGSGFTVATGAGVARQISLDAAHMSFRAPIVPAGPGSCQIGTSGWAADESGLYYCIVNHDAGTQEAVPFIWAQPHRYSVPDPATPGQWIWSPALR